jgi:hypothetical protein
MCSSVREPGGVKVENAEPNDEVELVSDGDGLAVIGEPSAVERFLAAVGLSASGSVPMLAGLRAGSAAAQVGSEVAANAGRWVKLTEESAQAVQRFGMTPTSTPGVSHAMIGKRGDIKQWIQIVQKPGTMLTNPAMLAGAAGLMAQLAMQQQMDAIMDYLAVIDQKLDAVLRSATNQVLSRLDGVDLAVREAMTVRASVGRVSEVTWSKVQASAQTIHEVEGYALRQLADLAVELERNRKVGDLVDLTKDAEAEVQKWLVVLARCFELHDAVGVLELDRVLDAAPNELDRHRIGLRSARAERLALISDQTGRLLERMQVVVGIANSKVLLNPRQSPSIVRSGNQVSADVHQFRQLLEIESDHDSTDTRRWRDAAAERLDQARAVGSQGVAGARRFGSGAQQGASAAVGAISTRLPGRRPSRNGDEQTS